MKPFLLLFLLLPFAVQANFYPGTITFTDATTRSGFIEIPPFDAPVVRFRAVADGNIEKFSPEKVSGFQVTMEGQIFNFKTIVTASPKLFAKQLTIDSSKSWLRVEAFGTIEMLSCEYVIINDTMGVGGGHSESTGMIYYIHWPENEYATYFYQTVGTKTPYGRALGAYKALVHMTKNYFQDKCPSLLTSMTKEIVKEKGMGWIADYYNQNCAKP